MIIDIYTSYVLNLLWQQPTTVCFKIMRKDDKIFAHKYGKKISSFYCEYRKHDSFIFWRLALIKLNLIFFQNISIKLDLTFWDYDVQNIRFSHEPYII